MAESSVTASGESIPNRADGSKKATSAAAVMEETAPQPRSSGGSLSTNQLMPSSQSAFSDSTAGSSQEIRSRGTRPPAT